MTYPALTRKNAVQIAEELLKEDIHHRVDAQIDQDKYVEEKQGQFDAKQFKADADGVLGKWNALVKSVKKVTKDDLVQFEIKIAPELFKTIKNVSIDCREDEDFWRYVALFPFRWYLIAREPELQPQDYGGLNEKVKTDEDGNEEIEISNSNMINQLIYRTYLIGKAIEDTSNSKDQFARKDAIPRKGPLTDIWQSHIIRVTIGRIGLVRHAFVDRVKTEQIAKERMKDFARDLASRLTRMRNNVVLDLHSKSEIDAVVKEISKQI
jgi:hypothetical protein